MKQREANEIIYNITNEFNYLKILLSQDELWKINLEKSLERIEKMIRDYIEE